MKCLETREWRGMRKRRYLLDDGRRTTTVEIPLTVLKAFSTAQVAEALAKYARGEATRARAVAMRARIAEGVKPDAIAQEFGVTAERVRQIKRGLHEQLRTNKSVANRLW